MFYKNHVFPIFPYVYCGVFLELKNINNERMIYTNQQKSKCKIISSIREYKSVLFPNAHISIQQHRSLYDIYILKKLITLIRLKHEMHKL